MVSQTTSWDCMTWMNEWVYKKWEERRRRMCKWQKRIRGGCKETKISSIILFTWFEKKKKKKARNRESNKIPSQTKFAVRNETENETDDWEGETKRKEFGGGRRRRREGKKTRIKMRVTVKKKGEKRGKRRREEKKGEKKKRRRREKKESSNSYFERKNFSCFSTSVSSSLLTPDVCHPLFVFLFVTRCLSIFFLVLLFLYLEQREEKHVPRKKRMVIYSKNFTDVSDKFCAWLFFSLLVCSFLFFCSFLFSSRLSSSSLVIFPVIPWRSFVYFFSPLFNHIDSRWRGRSVCEDKSREARLKDKKKDMSRVDSISLSSSWFCLQKNERISQFMPTK